MIINLTVVNDHSISSNSKSFGVQGDHRVTTLRATFEKNSYTFVKGRFNFEKNDLVECTDYIPLDENQAMEYELPYNLLCDCRSIVASVTAFTEDGRIFESRAMPFEVSENELDPSIIPIAFPLEEVTATKNYEEILPSDGMYGISKVNVRLPMHEIQIRENGEYNVAAGYEGISRIVVDILKPSLHAPTIEMVDHSTISIYADPENGSFPRGYKLFVGDDIIYTSGINIADPEEITMSFGHLMDVYPTGAETVRVKLYAEGFADSEFSNEVTWTPEIVTNGIRFTMGKDGWICHGFDDGVSGYANVPSYIKGVPVVELVDNAFKGSGVTSAVLPGTLKRIGSRIFQTNGDTLASVTLGYGIKEFSQLMFDRTRSMTSIEIPDSIEIIGILAFQGSGLTTVTIPDSVKTIKTAAFTLCESLETVYIGSGVKTIDNAFRDNTSITAIYCDFNEGDVAGAPWGASNAVIYYNWRIEGTEGLEYSENDATAYCSGIGTATDKDIRIASEYNGKAVIAVGESAFDGLSITSAYLPNTIKSIEKRAFATSKIRSVNIPDGVVSIKDSAFLYCTSLIGNIVIPDSVKTISVSAFVNCSLVSNFVIGAGVSSIEMMTFAQCSKLESVTFCGRVERINATAFNSCPSLKNIYVPWSEGDVAGAPWGASNAVIHYARSRYTQGLSYALVNGTYTVTGYGTATDKDVIIPRTIDGIEVTVIGEGAFYEAPITSIVIPETITELQAQSLYTCDQCLRTVTIKGRPTMDSLVSAISDSMYVYCFQEYALPFGEYVESYDDLGITDVYVSWSEGDVAGAPWGACEATIHYNSEV